MFEISYLPNNKHILPIQIYWLFLKHPVLVNLKKYIMKILAVIGLDLMVLKTINAIKYISLINLILISQT